VRQCNYDIIVKIPFLKNVSKQAHLLMDEQLTDSAVKQYRKCLMACVSVWGGHLQHTLRQNLSWLTA